MRALVLKRLDAEEKKLGVSLDYLRHMVRTSLRCFFKFALFTPMAAHRRRLPVEPCNVARLVTSRHADCGTCLQIAINVARQEGLAPELVRAVVDARPEDLPPDLRDVYLFTEAVLSATGEEDSLRESLRTRLGDEALIELSLAIASSLVFPTLKRSLGYAKSCSQVQLQFP